MTDKKNEAWREQAPDFMVMAIDTVLGARDDIRIMMEHLNTKSVDLNDKQQVMNEREEAFTNAVLDLRSLANKFYGPDSELSQVQSKIYKIEERLDIAEKGIIDLKRKVG